MPDNFANELFVSFLKQLLPFWWFFLGLFVVYTIIELYPDIVKRIQQNKKFSLINDNNSERELLNKLRNLKPTEFEDYIAHLYSNLGYFTERVGRSHDGGIDVIAEKNGIKYYIQCKKFITSKVSVGAVRDFYGAMTDRLAQGKGIFITTNIFTTEAEKFAEMNPIELIDGHDLLRLIKLVSKEHDIVMPTINTESLGDCPRCGKELVRRDSKKGPFIGCTGFPKCRYIKNI